MLGITDYNQQLEDAASATAPQGQTGRPAQVSEEYSQEQKALRQKYEAWKTRVRMGEMVPPAVQQWMKMIETHYPGWK